MLNKLCAARTLPRADYAARLLQSVAREFDGFAFQALAATRAELCAPDTTLKFFITARREGQFLAQTLVTDFELPLRADACADAEISLHHTGAITRGGIAGKLVRDDAAAQDILTRLLNDAAFVKMLLPLDMTRFILAHRAGAWRVETTQMGASFVELNFPPTRRYIPMGRAQVETLLAAFRHLQKMFAASEET